MKRIIFIVSSLCNVILLYKLSEKNKDIYNLSERANFYKNKFEAVDDDK
ncbi:hypothetical protein GA0061075_11024 [Weissella hellenica]|uniref:Uncharacterized protein n=1 Tax=Weissella hellenica TaxID=46256 RepID=A0ABY0K1S2_WEIHE|nr:hypothetical protein GA0061075_11024 [Weissella hellenica]